MHFVPESGRVRASSAAFDDDPDGSPMSVVLVDVLVARGGGPQHVLEGHEGFALAEITAALGRQNGQRILRDPQPGGPADQAHALVAGRKTKSVRRRLAEGSRWVVAPPSPAPDSSGRAGSSGQLGN